MAGLAVPTWDPETAMIIGVILIEAAVLYVGYAGVERVVGPRLLAILAGGDDDV